MNAIYRSIWNEGIRAWVAASELAKGRCKGSGRAAGGAAKRAWVWGGALVAAGHLAPAASAADYPISSAADLMNAAAQTESNAEPDTSFTLGTNISTLAGTVLTVPTVPTILIVYTNGLGLNLNGAGTVWDTGSYKAVQFNDGGPGTDTFTVTNGATVRITGFLNFLAGGLRIAGSGSSLNIGGILPIGGDLAVGRGGDAAVSLDNRGTLTTNRTFLGEDAANTLATLITATVDGPGAVWTADKAFVMGGAVNSVNVTVSNGGMIQIPHASGVDSAVGRNGAASLLVTGPGSRLVVGGSPGAFAIGAYQVAPGQGTLTIRDGGRVTAPYVVMGYGDSGSTGALTVDSGGVLETVSLFRDAGSATVHFDNGTLRALADNTPGQAVIALFAPGTVTLGAGGMFLDSNGFDVNVNSEFSGVGGLTKLGAGSATLLTGHGYGGTTAVAQGTLKAGIANAFSAASAHTVAAGATLDTAGLDQRVASLDNAGTVTLLGGDAGSTLSVNGAYVGRNGLLKLGTVLGDSGSVSDRLVLDGPAASASGSTTVQITNLGGLGALTTGNGIEVIGAVNGATTTAQSTKSAFRLAGEHVDAGAFEYRLYAADASGTGESWYLRSTVAGTPSGDGAPATTVTAYRPEVPQYAALPEQLRLGNLVMLSNLHQRVGDDAGAGAERQAWGRVISMDRTVSQTGTVSPRSEGRLNGFQAGTDLWAAPAWHAGLYVGQLDGDMDVHGFASGITNLAAGSNDLRSQYLGAYATYQHPSGFYVDTVLQGGRHRYDVSPWTAPASHGKGDSLLASVEVGRSFGVAPGWVLEPQLQLMHQRIDLDDARIAGADIRQDSHDGWIVRAGLRVKGDISTGAGRLQPYARFNLYRSSGGTDITRFIGPAGFADIATGTGGTSSELAAGATLALSPRVSLYGELGTLWASGGDVRARSGLNGSVGVKMRW